MPSSAVSRLFAEVELRRHDFHSRMTWDVVVSGDLQVGTRGGLDLQAADIAISDGRIGAISAHGKVGDAEEVIDASGLHVLPGVVDPHVHFGLGHRDDWETESRAAAQGGVTTVLNYVQSADSYRSEEPAERERASRASVIDFAIHPIIMNERHLSEIPAYVDEHGIQVVPEVLRELQGRRGCLHGRRRNRHRLFLRTLLAPSRRIPTPCLRSTQRTSRRSGGSCPRSRPPDRTTSRHGRSHVPISLKRTTSSRRCYFGEIEPAAGCTFPHLTSQGRSRSRAPPPRRWVEERRPSRHAPLPHAHDGFAKWARSAESQPAVAHTGGYLTRSGRVSSDGTGRYGSVPIPQFSSARDHEARVRSGPLRPGFPSVHDTARRHAQRGLPPAWHAARAYRPS